MGDWDRRLIAVEDILGRREPEQVRTYEDEDHGEITRVTIRDRRVVAVEFADTAGVPLPTSALWELAGRVVTRTAGDRARARHRGRR